MLKRRLALRYWTGVVFMVEIQLMFCFASPRHLDSSISSTKLSGMLLLQLRDFLIERGSVVDSLQ